MGRLEEYDPIAGETGGVKLGESEGQKIAIKKFRKYIFSQIFKWP
jgi:hypothetical protein